MHSHTWLPAQTIAVITDWNALTETLQSGGSELFTYTDQTGKLKSMPGVHWPVYVYTDAPTVETDLTVEKTPLHNLHNATVMHENCNAMSAPDTTVVSTEHHLTMLFEGRTVQQRLKLCILMDTGATLSGLRCWRN